MKKSRRAAWGVAVIIASAFIVGNSSAYAYDPPVVVKDLAGMPISCSIYPSQAEIGGVRVGITTGKVRNILGEPSGISDDKGKIRYYYDGLILTFIDYGGEERTVLRNIKITRDSKYTTVDGVSVGMSEEELTRIYGMADTVYIQKYTVPKLNEEQNGEYDKRMNKTIYTYNVGQNLAMHFMVKCGIIVDIQVNLQD